ncbi:MAG TPA: complex I NDUFA9 subunit family protein [Sphingomicrobium sp.]|nr:complex I NDUFA9 subunit family protein [Sphingomicrobium sp.]
MDSSITVFGGSGFLGRQIVKRLAEESAHVRVAVRHPERASFLERAGRAEQITAIYADVWEEASVGAAVDGSEAVINMVGHYVERGRANFETTSGHGAMHVAKAAATAGVQRLVHISGLGTDPKPDSRYSRARSIGEQLVMEAFPAATILRPGVIFGREGGFLNRLAALARMPPLFPLFGAGETKLQPVYVGDVAEAVAKALATPATMGRLYELGGPRVYTYKELVQLVLAQIERKRLLMPIPYFAWKVVAALMAPLPSRPLSRNQIELMQQDNVVRADALTLADLGIAPTPVEAMWPR